MKFINFAVLSVMCNVGYIGKTDRNLGTWIKEHCGLDKNSPIILQSVISTSSPLRYIVFHVMVM